MAVHPIVLMGDPRIFQNCELVKNFNTPALDTLIEDMWETMHQQNGIGLAAPQIGVAKRLVVFGGVDSPNNRDADAVPKTVLINPTLTLIGDESDEMWEGCLSIPGMRGVVPRHTHIRYQGFDQQGNTIDCEATGFHARVVQHELDHIDGRLYPMRIQDLTLFGFEQALLKAAEQG